MVVAANCIALECRMLGFQMASFAGIAKPKTTESLRTPCEQVSKAPPNQKKVRTQCGQQFHGSDPICFMACVSEIHVTSPPPPPGTGQSQQVRTGVLTVSQHCMSQCFFRTPSKTAAGTYPENMGYPAFPGEGAAA